ncbi:hypothetical protein [Burkholderia ubonensis]|uniref:hypothetical protein n=1 Tax=Burkholderia ubonensis TaxID=101571 RepID=UPI0012FD57C0|nr:hypothetical protein [Burkholderia ubonensis]
MSGRLLIANHAFLLLFASMFVAWGVMHGVFIWAALPVAVFDGASGLLYLDLRRRGG